MMSLLFRRHLHQTSLSLSISSAAAAAASAATPRPHRWRPLSGAVGIRPLSTARTRRREPTQSWISEERFIAQAIRTIGERKHRVVVEVMNACHVDWAARRLPSRGLMRRNASLWVRVLTHADMLSDEALRHQMERASVESTIPGGDGDGRRMPVVAVNLRDAASSGKWGKALRPLRRMLLGAKTAGGASNDKSPLILVCGLPNAGKSSLIYPLTKQRTVEVRKKKGYHLPSINVSAGWTLGIKSHAFDLKVPKEASKGKNKKVTVTLTDTPGLRPRLEDMMSDVDSLAGWLATQSMKPPKGMLSKSNEDCEGLREGVLTVLWRGLRRHAEVSSEEFVFESPEELLLHHSKDNGNADALQHLMQSCASGDYGGMIVEDRATTRSATPRQGEEHPEQRPLSINRGSVVMAMNQSAASLVDVGASTLLGKRSPDDEMNSRTRRINSRALPSPRSSGKSEQENGINRDKQQPSDNNNGTANTPGGRERAVPPSSRET